MAQPLAKKYMRNEIWSLFNFIGAPYWYITLSPADIKHPICIYYADTNEEFKPEILPHDKHTHLVCQNPVAGACFFHFMVETFISDVWELMQSTMVYMGIQMDIMVLLSNKGV